MNENRPESPPRVKIPTQRDHTRCDIAGQFETLRGRRVVLMNDDGQHEDYRAYGEVYLVDGNPYLDVCRERHWYLMDFGVEPRLLRWPAGAAWLD